MKENSLVSILMPVKNSSKFLEECINSILIQTYTNWELIVVDDFSSDTSYEIIYKYSQKDQRIKCFKSDKPGIISALQLAFNNSKGEYITRMDSDDVMIGNKIELLLNKLISVGSGYVSTGLVEYFSLDNLGEGYLKYAKWLNQLSASDSNFDEIYKECSIPSPCWMISKVDFEKCGAFNSEVYPEDYDLAFRFKKAKLRTANVKKIIHKWRDYSTRTSRTDKNYADNNFFKLKVNHFIKQDRKIKHSLVLWGSGTKGKNIAKLLIENGETFIWICNNKNKIGKEIYGINIVGLERLNSNDILQVIIAVSSPKDLDEIEDLIKINSKHQYFKFC